MTESDTSSMVSPASLCKSRPRAQKWVNECMCACAHMPTCVLGGGEVLSMDSWGLWCIKRTLLGTCFLKATKRGLQIIKCHSDNVEALTFAKHLYVPFTELPQSNEEAKRGIAFFFYRPGSWKTVWESRNSAAHHACLKSRFLILPRSSYLTLLNFK